MDDVQHVETPRAAAAAELCEGCSKVVGDQKALLEEREHEIEQREQQVEKKVKGLEEEKARMKQIEAQETDIVCLNVGGTLFSTSRGTLCAEPGTVLEFMFSGRWENSVTKDKNGVPFFDFNPELFSVLLDHLRDKTLSAPDEQLALPTLPAQLAYKQRTYEKMLQYLGFMERYTEGVVGRFSKLHSDEKFTISTDGKTATLEIDLVKRIVFAKIAGVCEKGKSITLKPIQSSRNLALPYINVGILPIGGVFYREGYTFGITAHYCKGETIKPQDGEKYFASGNTLKLTLDTEARTLTLRNLTTGKTVVVEDIDTSKEYVFAFGGSASGLRCEIIE